jgi:hypothetical protein
VVSSPRAGVAGRPTTCKAIRLVVGSPGAPGLQGLGEALIKVFIEQPRDALIVWLADYLPVLANVATREDLMRELVKRILLWKFTMLRINYFQ